MSLKSSIRYISIKLRRDKKNLFLMIFLIICSVVILTTLTFRNNYLKNLQNSIDKSITFRTLVVDPTDDPLSEDEKILGVNHVLEVYQNNYGFYDINVPTYNTENYDGMVELLYGTENILPENVIGKKFSKDDTGVAICPIVFYPWMDGSKEMKNDYLDGNKLLNTTFEVEREVYKFIDGKVVKSDEKYHKTFKIIGLYDNNEVYQDPFNCYISASDMKDLYDSTIQNNPNVLYGKFAVVDDRSNVEYVMKELSNLGFTSQVQSYIDSKLINSLKNTCNFIIIFTICIMIFISLMYIHKKNINDMYQYGVLKSLGYRNKDILKINIFQLLFMSIISFFIGILIFELLFRFAIIFYQKYFIYNSIFVRHFVDAYLITLIIILFIPTIISYLLLNKKINSQSASAMLGNKNDN